MKDYNIVKHYNKVGAKLEDIILGYFKIYLDINSGICE